MGQVCLNDTLLTVTASFVILAKARIQKEFKAFSGFRIFGRNDNGTEV